VGYSIPALGRYRQVRDLPDGESTVEEDPQLGMNLEDVVDLFI
jgi:hypothetical protein